MSVRLERTTLLGTSYDPCDLPRPQCHHVSKVPIEDSLLRSHGIRQMSTLQPPAGAQCACAKGKCCYENHLARSQQQNQVDNKVDSNSTANNTATTTTMQRPQNQQYNPVRHPFNITVVPFLYLATPLTRD